MKKFISVFLSLIMIFSLALPAFAADAAAVETPFEDSRFFEYGEYTIHYRVWEAEQPVGQIFMIHGFALSSYCFTSLAAILRDNGYTCVLADLPDFGYSSRETAETEKLPREDIMHALMKYLSDDPWYVAGHSMGGYISLALAQKYPEDVKNLLLYGTAGNDPDTSAMTAIMNNKTFVKIMGPIMQAAGGCTPLVKMLLIFAYGDLPYAMGYDVTKVMDPFKIKGTGEGALYSFSMLPNTNFETLNELAPILYVNGSKDNVIPNADKEKLRTYLPEGSVDYIVEGGYHLFIENFASETATVTLNFLADHP